MLLVVAWTISMVLWIIMWAVGVKALDGFMLVVLIMVSAAAVHVVLPNLPGNKNRQ